MHFTRAIENGNLEGYYYRGMIAYTLGSYGKAEEFFLLAHNVKPVEMAALMGSGKSAIRQKNYSRAVDYLLEACRYAEGSIAPELLLAIAYRVADNRDDARKHLQNVLARDPLNLPAIYEITTGDYPESETVQRELSRLLKDDPNYSMDLACYFLNSGLPETALDILEDPGSGNPAAMTSYLRAYIYFLLGKEKNLSLFWEKHKLNQLTLVSQVGWKRSWPWNLL